MPAKKTSANRLDNQSLPPVASMKFWSRFKNPMPMLAVPTAESGPGARESIDFLSKLPAVPTDETITYIIRISLDGSRPPVWRRVLTKSVNLDVLHRIIQVSMGWDDSHLHSFEIRKHPVPLVEDDTEIDESSISIARLFAARIKKFQYTYDFGDSWNHVVSLESSCDASKELVYPHCLAGRGACPLEDCGGVERWTRFWDAMRDGENDPDEDIVLMRNRVQDLELPLRFELAETNSRLRRAFDSSPNL